MSDKPKIRDLLRGEFPTDEQFMEFCIDHFPDISQRFTSTMDRLAKENLLLQCKSIDDIYAKIKIHLRLRPSERENLRDSGAASSIRKDQSRPPQFPHLSPLLILTLVVSVVLLSAALVAVSRKSALLPQHLAPAINPSPSFELQSNSPESHDSISQSIKDSKGEMLLIEPGNKHRLMRFYMDVHEVTVELYERCIKERACEEPQATLQGLSNEQRAAYQPFCNYGKRTRQQHPINCVTEGMAESFCRWAHKRLPSEQEWMYAAFGTENRKYPWGEQEPDEQRMNGCGLECASIMLEKIPEFRSDQNTALYQASDGHVSTAPVGVFRGDRTPIGVLDMAGNVAEWTSTLIVDQGYAVRGGSWLSGGKSIDMTINRSGSRSGNAAISTIGFRCVRTAD